MMAYCNYMKHWYENAATPNILNKAYLMTLMEGKIRQSAKEKVLLAA